MEKLSRACWSATSANPNWINSDNQALFERESGNRFPLFLCLRRFIVDVFVAFLSFPRRKTFHMWIFRFLPYIKWFSPLNNKFLRKTINFYEVLAQSEGKTQTFLRMEAKRNQNCRFSLHFSSPLGLLFHSLIISHITIKVQVFSLPMLYLKHKEGQRTREKQNLSK